VAVQVAVEAAAGGAASADQQTAAVCFRIVTTALLT
jgi:hypothetical protein